MLTTILLNRLHPDGRAAKLAQRIQPVIRGTLNGIAFRTMKHKSTHRLAFGFCLACVGMIHGTNVAADGSNQLLVYIANYTSAGRAAIYACEPDPPADPVNHRSCMRTRRLRPLVAEA